MILSYFVALGSTLGSAEYTPSIVLANSITSASISAALKAAAVSVEKNGWPVPPAKITILPFLKCFAAFLTINGSAISHLEALIHS